MSALIETKNTQPPRSDVLLARKTSSMSVQQPNILGTLHQSTETNLLLSFTYVSAILMNG
jgi:hypothetical protein